MLNLWKFGMVAVAVTLCKTTFAGDLMDLNKAFATEQVIIVRTLDWTATSGTLVAYDRVGEKWQQVLGPIEVQVGRAGMAWGPGLHDESLNRPPLKREGDGKSPAGIFRLESLYGYGELQAKMPYLQVDSNTFCVDDPKSKHYNQIVRGDEVEKDWDSAETMRMDSDVYKYGIVVGYNTEKTTAGAGSCIFMHLGKPGTTTAGCTGMAEKDILKLIGWLDKPKNPLLVQAPAGGLRELGREYELP